MSGPGDDTADLLARLQVAAIHLGRQTRRIVAGELTESQHRALASIVKFGPLSPSALAEREGLHAAAVSRLVTHLEGAGLVRRAPEPGDGRRCLLTATAAGVRLLLRMREAGTRFLDASLTMLKPEDADAVLAAVPALEALAAAGWVQLDSEQPLARYLPAGQADAVGRVGTRSRSRLRPDG